MAGARQDLLGATASTAARGPQQRTSTATICCCRPASSISACCSDRRTPCIQQRMQMLGSGLTSGLASTIAPSPDDGSAAALHHQRGSAPICAAGKHFCGIPHLPPVVDCREGDRRVERATGRVSDHRVRALCRALAEFVRARDHSGHGTSWGGNGVCHCRPRCSKIPCAGAASISQRTVRQADGVGVGNLLEYFGAAWTGSVSRRPSKRPCSW